MTGSVQVRLTPDLFRENEAFNLPRCWATSYPVGAVTFLATRLDRSTSLEALSARCAESLQSALRVSTAFADFSLYLFASARVLPLSPRPKCLMRQHGPRPALHFLEVGERAVEIEIADPVDTRFAAIVPVEQEQVAASTNRCRRDGQCFVFLAPEDLAITPERVLDFFGLGFPPDRQGRTTRPDFPRLILGSLEDDIYPIRMFGAFDDRDVALQVFGRAERLDRFYRDILSSSVAGPD